MVPYSGTIRATIVQLEPGLARLRMADRRGVRNHLRSIHAVALANLGELTSGLAMTSALPPGARSIVTRLTTEYLKKARGPMEATGRARPPEADRGTVEVQVVAEIADRSGEVVARTTATWRVDLPEIRP